MSAPSASLQDAHDVQRDFRGVFVSASTPERIAAELSAMTDAELRAVADRTRGTSKRGVRRKMTHAEVVLLAAIISEQERRT